MRFYWDTSAVINAALSDRVWARLASDEHFTSPHMLFEFFSTMTGRGIETKDATGVPARLVFSQSDAVQWLSDFAGRVEIVSLNSGEILAALDQTHELGVKGARVYDLSHALAAQKAKADVVLTRNERHFAGLVGSAHLQRP